MAEFRARAGDRIRVVIEGILREDTPSNWDVLNVEVAPGREVYVEFQHPDSVVIEVVQFDSSPADSAVSDA